MVKTCVEKYGRIDFVMNNAGVGEGGVKTADMRVEMFDQVCDTNEKGASDRRLIPIKATYFEVFRQGALLKVIRFSCVKIRGPAHARSGTTPHFH